MPGTVRTPAFVVVAIGGVLAATAGLVAVLYATPPDARGILGIESTGARLYLAALGLSGTEFVLSPTVFRVALRACLIVMWGSWVTLVALLLHLPGGGGRSARWLIVTVALVLAVAAPPVLSTDVLSYVAYGRLSYVHHLNPYQSGLGELVAAGDPAAELLFGPMRMPYGPLWPLMMGLVGPPAAAIGTFAEVLVHKILAAAALVGMAIAGARAAETCEPGRGPVALLAIGLNPLLLVEGPIGGHNDLPAVFFVMCAIALSSRRRFRAAWASLGVAVALKATALAVLPLVAFAHVIRSQAGDRWRGLLWLIGLTVLPAVLASFFYGGPAILADAVGARLGVTGPAGAVAWIARGVLVASFAAASWLIYSDPSRSWVAGWVVVGCALVLAGTTLRLPWYLVWAMAPVLTRWDERHRILITAVSTCGFLLMWLYTVGL